MSLAFRSCVLLLVALYVHTNVFLGLGLVDTSLLEPGLGLDLIDDVLLERHRPLRVGSFNIQVLGTRKLSRLKVIRNIIWILSRYDIVAIQEIRDDSQTVGHKLLKLFNEHMRKDYGIVVSKRLGRTDSKEQYAFLYRKSLVSVLKKYLYRDRRDVFEREPYAVKFHCPTCKIQEFAVMNNHITPKDVYNELKELAKVVGYAKRSLRTKNIIITGDLNADCRYLSNRRRKKLKLYKSSTYEWLIPSSSDTTVSDSDCAYDRLIVTGDFRKLLDPHMAHVFRFDESLHLTQEEALKISDHYPVEVGLPRVED